MIRFFIYISLNTTCFNRSTNSNSGTHPPTYRFSHSTNERTYFIDRCTNDSSRSSTNDRSIGKSGSSSDSGANSATGHYHQQPHCDSNNSTRQRGAYHGATRYIGTYPTCLSGSIVATYKRPIIVSHAYLDVDTDNYDNGSS